MDEQEKNAPKAVFGRPFEVGNTIGKGRPKGSRNKLKKAFLRDVLADWMEHGASAMSDVRTSKPDVYVKVIADLLPKEVEVKGQHEHTHRAVSDSAAWLAGMLRDGETGSLQAPMPH